MQLVLVIHVEGVQCMSAMSDVEMQDGQLRTALFYLCTALYTHVTACISEPAS